MSRGRALIRLGRRLPIRVRLTIAFGSAMLLMLAGAALFVYVRLEADLDDRIDASLRSRAAALVTEQEEPSLAGAALEDPEEGFAQLLSVEGELRDAVGTLRQAALTPDEARRAAAGPITVERELPGVDGRARMLARPADAGATTVVVVGQSLVDRNDALDNVVASFLIGGVVAIVLASLIGYVLARAGLAPVDAMRRKAREVSLRTGDAGLPLPEADDEIRRLGETLNEMLARLSAAFERESRFVADASHELRTPIAVIKTELEGALLVTSPDSPAHPALVAAAEECDRLAQLAEDLLVIARAAEGQLPIRPEPTDVARLLDGIRDRFVDRAGRQGRAIVVDVEAGLVVHADPQRARQALGNLVDNALRHGAGDVALAARRTGAGVELAVTDQGPGFPADIAPHAFERFVRGDPARSGTGVGLGLAIVQAIAEAHGGTATISQTAPTTVRIWLPAANSA